MTSLRALTIALAASIVACMDDGIAIAQSDVITKDEDVRKMFYKTVENENSYATVDIPRICTKQIESLQSEDIEHGSNYEFTVVGCVRKISILSMCTCIGSTTGSFNISMYLELSPLAPWKINDVTEIPVEINADTKRLARCYRTE